MVPTTRTWTEPHSASIAVAVHWSAGLIRQDGKDSLRLTLGRAFTLQVAGPTSIGGLLLAAMFLGVPFYVGELADERTAAFGLTLRECQVMTGS